MKLGNIKLNKRMCLFIIIPVVILVGVIGFMVFRKNNSLQKTFTDSPFIPIYPGATFTDSAYDLQSGISYNGVKYSTSWASQASVPEVAVWYITHLQSEGWTLDLPPANPYAYDIQLISFFNDKYTLNVSVLGDMGSGKTSITAEFTNRLSDIKEPGEDEVGE